MKPGILIPVALGLAYLLLSAVGAAGQSVETDGTGKAAPGMWERAILDEISNRLGITVGALREQMDKYEMTYGELFVAYVVSASGGLRIDDVASRPIGQWSSMIPEKGTPDDAPDTGKPSEEASRSNN